MADEIELNHFAGWSPIKTSYKSRVLRWHRYCPRQSTLQLERYETTTAVTSTEEELLWDHWNICITVRNSFSLSLDMNLTLAIPSVLSHLSFYWFILLVFSRETEARSVWNDSAFCCEVRRKGSKQEIADLAFVRKGVYSKWVRNRLGGGHTTRQLAWMIFVICRSTFFPIAFAFSFFSFTVYHGRVFGWKYGFRKSGL